MSGLNEELADGLAALADVVLSTVEYQYAKEVGRMFNLASRDDLACL